MIEVAARQAELARSGSAAQRAAIFLHIGKTAGTTLGVILRQRYRGAASFMVDSATTAPGLEQLQGLDPDARNRLRLVRGHLLYGVHGALGRQALYFTMLRDPYARTVSAYEYILAKRAHRLHGTLTSRAMTFVEYVTSGVTLETDNWQVRCVAGDAQTPFGCCDGEMLEHAKRNIARDFALVGLTERFDESLVVLARMYGWKHICYASLNRTTSRSAPMASRSALLASRSAPTASKGAPRASSAEQMALLEPHLALDRELYAYAERLLEAVLDEVGGIEGELRALRRRNRLYGPLGRAVDVLWRPVRHHKDAQLLRGA